MSKNRLDKLRRSFEAALASGDNKSIYRYFKTLGCIGGAAVPLLIDVLRKETDSDTRNSAIRALGAIGPAAIDAVPELLEATKDEANVAISDAEFALEAIGPEVIPYLIEAMHGEHRVVQRKAINVLGLLGPAALGVVPKLISILQHEIEYIDKYKQLNKDELIINSNDNFHVVLKHRDVFFEVICSLKEIGAEAEAALPSLIQALRCSDSLVRREAARALGEFGPAASMVLPDLFHMLNDEDQLVRPEALRALSMISPTAKELIIAARKLLKNEDMFMRESAASALARAGPLADDAMPELLAALRDQSDSVSKWAGHAISSVLLTSHNEKVALVAEWDMEASGMMRQLKLFYLLFPAYMRGDASLRKACDANTSQYISRMLKERIPTTYPNLAPNLRKLNPLFAKIFSNVNFNIFMTNQWVKGESYKFSEDARIAWEWTDAFLRRQKSEANWYGLTTLPGEQDGKGV